MQNTSNYWLNLLYGNVVGYEAFTAEINELNGSYSITSQNSTIIENIRTDLLSLKLDTNEDFTINIKFKFTIELLKKTAIDTFKAFLINKIKEQSLKYQLS